MFPKDRTFNGMIAMYHHDPEVRKYIRNKAKSTPTVILGTQNPGVPGATMVMPDNEQSGILAAEHLYDRFHKNYGWFASDICPSGRERKHAFEKRLKELGYSCIDLSCGHSTFDEKTVLRKLKQCPKPIGVMARDDHGAAVLIDLCQQAELRTPEDVAIIGVGDIESLCAFSPMPISSINLNMDELGYQSAAVLDKLMQGRTVPKKTVIPPGPLQQRLSTACLALTHPRLKAAVQLIDKNYQSLLTTDELASTAGVSRRQLYTLFRDEMRCSPSDYLMNVRLQHARNLISKNRLNLYEIADQCGFNTPRTLNRAFHQRFGVAPSKWEKLSEDD